MDKTHPKENLHKHQRDCWLHRYHPLHQPHRAIRREPTKAVSYQIQVYGLIHVYIL